MKRLFSPFSIGSFAVLTTALLASIVFAEDTIAQDLWEVTGTLKWQMSEHLQARLEYRHDESNRSSFEKDSRFQKGQDTMILEFAYLM